jgi:hypothetical protein
MTNTDWTPEGQPSEEADPLSATGMFLSALGKESDQPQKQPEERAAEPVVRLETKQTAWPSEQAPSPSPANPASAGATQGSPGEFTRLFQAAQPPRATPPQAPAVQSPAPTIEPKPAPASAPGEFTRIFVKPAEARPADRPFAPLARSTPEPASAPQAAPGSPRMKGFSSGSSDSASVEGGFTQFFQSRPSAPAPAPTPRVQAFTPPTPPPAMPAEEIKWPHQPEFNAVKSSASPEAGATSATGLFASLGAAGQHQEEVRPQPVEPPPSFSPAPPAAPSSDESGSVTRLIQRLSEGVRATPQAEAPQPPEAPAGPPSQALDSGPGEFTRMISASQFKAPAGAPVQPAAAPPQPPPPFSMPAAPPFSVPTAAPPMAMPPAPKPAAAPAPPAFQAPKIELPPAPVPKPAPPALAAPAGKFQEMVPILLVVNTFLLLVLIVLVIFALKAR